MTEGALGIISHYFAEEPTRSGENYLGLIHNRPRAAVANNMLSLRCGPSIRTFAATAKSGDSRTHSVRTKLTFATPARMSASPLLDLGNTFYLTVSTAGRRLKHSAAIRFLVKGVHNHGLPSGLFAWPAQHLAQYHLAKPQAFLPTQQVPDSRIHRGPNSYKGLHHTQAKQAQKRVDHCPSCL